MRKKRTGVPAPAVPLTRKEIITQTGVVLVGALLFAISMHMFLLPCSIVIGGVTGISTILNILFNTPVGLVIILINIPLVIVNSLIFGARFMTKTMIGIAASSIATDILAFLPPMTTDPFLAAVFGGIIMGVSLGLLFSKGYTTGGTDLIACLSKLRFPKLSTGKLILAADFLIVAASCVVTREFNGGFYSVIAIFVSSFFIDKVVDGAARAKLALIITDKPTEISSAVISELDRGVTLLTAKGGFTGKDKQVVMCVVKKDQIYDLKSLINRISPEAFIVFADAAQVRGSGFETDSLE